MRLNIFAATLAAASAVALLLPADPAAAAAKKKAIVVARNAGTVVVMPDNNGRMRTRVIVQKRSFLDAGTEVLPGERKFTDYVYPPNYHVTDVIDNTSRGHRFPLPGPWDIPGKNNPGQMW